jgi:hypothetical protein
MDISANTRVKYSKIQALTAQDIELVVGWFSSKGARSMTLFPVCPSEKITNEQPMSFLLKYA